MWKKSSFSTVYTVEWPLFWKAFECYLPAPMKGIMVCLAEEDRIYLHVIWLTHLLHKRFATLLGC